MSSFTLETRENILTVTFNPPRGVSMPALTGAPYCADQVSEHVQTLSDGTHITQPARVQHYCRDSGGRTRTERWLLFTSDPNTKNVAVDEIRDPVAGFYYILDQQNKVAHRFATPSNPTKAAVSAPTRVEAAAPSTAPKPGDSRPEPSLEKLGTQLIEGVMAEGVRSTTKWPVGAQGNDRPIVASHEEWFSQELKTAVLRKIFDPRNGEDTFKLTNISLTEPDPGLFQAPPDYTIVDEKGSFIMSVTRR